MKAALGETRLVSRVFHPTPEGEFLDLGNGINAAVLVGEPAYQVTTGEMVKL